MKNFFKQKVYGRSGWVAKRRKAPGPNPLKSRGTEWVMRFGDSGIICDGIRPGAFDWCNSFHALLNAVTSQLTQASHELMNYNNELSAIFNKTHKTLKVERFRSRDPKPAERRARREILHIADKEFSDEIEV